MERFISNRGPAACMRDSRQSSTLPSNPMHSQGSRNAPFPNITLGPVIEVIKHYDPNVIAINSSTGELPYIDIESTEEIVYPSRPNNKISPKIKSKSHTTSKKNSEVIKKKIVNKKTNKQPYSKKPQNKQKQYMNELVLLEDSVNALGNKLAALDSRIQKGVRKYREPLTTIQRYDSNAITPNYGMVSAPERNPAAFYVQELKNEIMTIPPGLCGSIAADLKSEISEYLISRTEPDVSINRNAQSSKRPANAVTFDCEEPCEAIDIGGTLNQGDCCFPLPAIRLVDLSACTCTCSSFIGSNAQHLCGMKQSCNNQIVCYSAINKQKNEVTSNQNSNSSFCTCNKNAPTYSSVTDLCTGCEDNESLSETCCASISNAFDSSCTILHPCSAEPPSSETVSGKSQTKLPDTNPKEAKELKPAPSSGTNVRGSSSKKVKGKKSSQKVTKKGARSPKKESISKAQPEKETDKDKPADLCCEDQPKYFTVLCNGEVLRFTCADIVLLNSEPNAANEECCKTLGNPDSTTRSTQKGSSTTLKKVPSKTDSKSKDLKSKKTVKVNDNDKSVDTCCSGEIARDSESKTDKPLCISSSSILTLASSSECCTSTSIDLAESIQDAIINQCIEIAQSKKESNAKEKNRKKPASKNKNKAKDSDSKCPFAPDYFDVCYKGETFRINFPQDLLQKSESNINEDLCISCTDLPRPTPSCSCTTVTESSQDTSEAKTKQKKSKSKEKKKDNAKSGSETSPKSFNVCYKGEIFRIDIPPESELKTDKSVCISTTNIPRPCCNPQPCCTNVAQSTQSTSEDTTKKKKLKSKDKKEDTADSSPKYFNVCYNGEIIRINIPPENEIKTDKSVCISTTNLPPPCCMNIQNTGEDTGKKKKSKKDKKKDTTPKYFNVCYNGEIFRIDVPEPDPSPDQPVSKPCACPSKPTVTPKGSQSGTTKKVNVKESKSQQKQTTPAVNKKKSKDSVKENASKQFKVCYNGQTYTIDVPPKPPVQEACTDPEKCKAEMGDDDKKKSKSGLLCCSKKESDEDATTDEKSKEKSSKDEKKTKEESKDKKDKDNKKDVKEKDSKSGGDQKAKSDSKDKEDKKGGKKDSKKDEKKSDKKDDKKSDKKDDKKSDKKDDKKSDKKDGAKEKSSKSQVKEQSSKTGKGQSAKSQTDDDDDDEKGTSCCGKGKAKEKDSKPDVKEQPSKTSSKAPPSKTSSKALPPKGTTQQQGKVQPTKAGVKEKSSKSQVKEVPSKTSKGQPVKSETDDDEKGASCCPFCSKGGAKEKDSKPEVKEQPSKVSSKGPPPKSTIEKQTKEQATKAGTKEQAAKAGAKEQAAKAGAKVQATKVGVKEQAAKEKSLKSEVKEDASKLSKAPPVTFETETDDEKKSTSCCRFSKTNKDGATEKSSKPEVAEYLKIIEEKNVQIETLKKLLAESEKAALPTSKNEVVIKNIDLQNASKDNDTCGCYVDDQCIELPNLALATNNNKTLECTHCSADLVPTSTLKYGLSIQFLPPINIRPPLTTQNMPSVIINASDSVTPVKRNNNVVYKVLVKCDCNPTNHPCDTSSTQACLRPLVENAETQMCKEFVSDIGVQVSASGSGKQSKNNSPQGLSAKKPSLTANRSSITQWAPSQRGINDFIQEMIKDPRAELVYRSYQLLNERCQQEEEVELDEAALSHIDIDVYKTYVNPHGFKSVTKSISCIGPNMFHGPPQNFYKHEETQCGSSPNISNSSSGRNAFCTIKEESENDQGLLGIDKQVGVNFPTKSGPPQQNYKGTNTSTLEQKTDCDDCGLTKVSVTSDCGSKNTSSSEQNKSTMAKTFENSPIKNSQSNSSEYIITHDMASSCEDSSFKAKVIPTTLNSEINDNSSNKKDNSSGGSFDSFEATYDNDQDSYTGSHTSPQAVKKNSPDPGSNNPDRSPSTNKTVTLMPVSVRTTCLPTSQALQDLPGGDCLLQGTNVFMTSTDKHLQKKEISLCINRKRKIESLTETSTLSEVNPVISDGELNKSDGEVQGRDSTTSIGEIHTQPNKSRHLTPSTNYFQRKPQHLINCAYGKFGMKIIRKKTYKSNWVSYYISNSSDSDEDILSNSK